MAEDGSVASSVAAAAEHGGSAAAEPAGMEERTPLTELISDETGAMGTWHPKDFTSGIKDYKYTWKGREQTGCRAPAEEPEPARETGDIEQAPASPAAEQRQAAGAPA